MTATTRHREVCEAAGTDAVPGTTFEVPHMVWKKTWTDSDGIVWRARGQDLLEPKQARKLLARPEVRLMHIYHGEVHEHTGEDRDGLIAEVADYWAGTADPMASFQIREFRSKQHEVMALIQEHC